MSGDGGGGSSFEHQKYEYENMQDGRHAITQTARKYR